jgi:hypothetical protein
VFKDNRKWQVVNREFNFVSKSEQAAPNECGSIFCRQFALHFRLDGMETGSFDKGIHFEGFHRIVPSAYTNHSLFRMGQ